MQQLRPDHNPKAQSSGAKPGGSFVIMTGSLNNDAAPVVISGQLPVIRERLSRIPGGKLRFGVVAFVAGTLLATCIALVSRDPSGLPRSAKDGASSAVPSLLGSPAQARVLHKAALSGGDEKTGTQAAVLTPALAFHHQGSPRDRANAADCLAAAAWYEAGNDADGQRAVI